MFRYRYRKRKKPNVFKRVFLFLLVLAVAVFIFFEMMLRPMIAGIANVKATALATEAINTAAQKELQDVDFTYSDLATVQYTQDGNSIQGITTNSLNMNKLKAAYTLEAQKQIDSLRSRAIQVAVGDLTGIELFKGKGPRIPIALDFESSIETKVDSKFISAGINQTQHIIDLTITAKMFLIGDEGLKNVEVVTNVPIAETIIVGTVPALYLGKNAS